MNETTYGPGGFDPSHPNGNIIEQVVDHGDGTGTRTTYGDDGTIIATAAVDGLPVPPAVEPSGPAEAEIEAARLSLAAATTVSQTKTRALALDDLRAAQIAAIVS